MVQGYKTNSRICLESGIEPMPPAVEVQNPNHWTAREFPVTGILNKLRNCHLITAFSFLYNVFILFQNFQMLLSGECILRTHFSGLPWWHSG